jgi:hypothetical protein
MSQPSKWEETLRKANIFYELLPGGGSVPVTNLGSGESEKPLSPSHFAHNATSLTSKHLQCSTKLQEVGDATF